jgi:phospholipid/cholesterol/gamma-HCH transport system permease protein
MTRGQNQILSQASAIGSLPEAEMRLPSFELTKEADVVSIVFDGVWTTRTIGRVDRKMQKLEFRNSDERVQIDCSNVTMMDTAGAWMVIRLSRRLAAEGTPISVTGLSETHQVLVDAVDAAFEIEEPIESSARVPIFSRIFSRVGLGTFNFWQDFLAAMNILGAAVRGSQLKTGHTNRFSFAPIANQIDKMGVGAIPIVMLMSVIMGAIIAQQGAFQLRYFGAEIFVVDLVGILVLREIGVILTAIMIAGRSGSAITAEIGSMKMREEVDALKVIGLNPIGVLVFPRLAALVISLPLLTFLANMAALAGAMFVAQVYSGISPEAFIARVHEAVDLTSFFSGVIKAPFMAIIIGVIASVEGFKVGGSAESLGERVTSSVVKSIFVVIVVDGLFAMFFVAIDF